MSATTSHLAAVRPRALAHRGTVEAAAFWFDPALIGQAEVRRRILVAWTPGAQVFEVGGGWLLRLAAPRRVACDRAPGLPLSEDGGLLLAAPLTEDERRALDAPNGAAVLLRGGVAQVLPLLGLPTIDPAAWLDVAGFETLELASLGEAPPPPQLAMVETVFDVHQRLAVEAAPELLAMLAMWRGETTAPPSRWRGPRWMASLGARLRSMLAGRVVPAEPTAAAEPVAASVPPPRYLHPALAVALVVFCIALGVAVGLSATPQRLASLIGALIAILLLIGLGALVISGWVLIARAVWPGLRRGTSQSKTPAKPTPVHPLFQSSSDDLAPEWTLFWVALGLAIPAVLNGWVILAGLALLLMLGAAGYGFTHWGQYQAKRKAQGKAAPAAPPKPALPAPPKMVEGPFAGLRNWMARLAWMAGLWRVVGPRQARYIMRMLEMFERGDLDAALRHAIPLDSLPGKGLGAPALSVPKPRSLLEIFTGQRVGGAGIPLPSEVLQHLRRQYRAAHERLAEQGRLEEAAFVLAELLQASAEAVAFLERHGRLRLAAELAEGRQLASDLVVRQWFVAGERERAVLIARRSGAFAGAVARLEKGSEADRENAKVLRLLWANELARGGDFVAAVGAAWPVEAARHLTVEWIARGLALGGPLAARMLARQAQLATTLDAELRERVLDLLEDPDPEAAPARLEFAQRLVETPATPATQTLARATARALARDAGRDTFNEPRKTACQKLIDVADDGALRADLPPRLFPDGGAPLGQRATPQEWSFDAADAGATPLLDAAFLPDGRCIVALGEAGARLLARDGRVVAHFDQPCHRLVVSDHGDRAIALAPRGQAMRLARLDFAARRAVSWCETRLDSCAWSYDGSLWLVAADGQFFAVDATASRLAALWRTPDVGRVVFIDRSPVSCSFVTCFRTVSDAWGRAAETIEKWERWQFQLPALVLRQRTILANLGESVLASARAVAADGTLIDLVQTAESVGLWSGESEITRLTEIDAEAEPLGLTSGAAWWAALTCSPSGVCCHLVDRKAHQVRARVQLGGARHVMARLAESHLTLCDDRGRLLVVDLERGGLVRNSRIS